MATLKSYGISLLWILLCSSIAQAEEVESNIPVESNYIPEISENDTFYVKAVNGSICPSTALPDHCHTLDYYCKSSYFTSNRTFVFLSGNHSLQQVVDVEGVENLALVGTTNTSLVICDETINSVGFQFSDIDGLKLEELTFIRCGIRNKLYGMILAGSVIMSRVKNAIINRVTVTNTIGGYGLNVQNAIDNVFINNSLFTHNEANDIWYGGNTQIMFSGCEQGANVYVANSHFQYGKEINHSFHTAGCGGLTFNIMCSNIRVYITDSSFNFNSGYFGGNIFFSFTMLTNNTVSIHNVTSSNGKANRGAGLYVMLMSNIVLNDRTSCSEGCIQEGRHFFHFDDIRVIRNYGLAAFLFEDRTYSNTQCTPQYALIENSAFNENFSPIFLWAGTAVRFGYIASLIFYTPFRLIQATFLNCSFLRNIGTLKREGTQRGTEPSAIYFEFVQNVTLINCSIGENNESGIQGFMSNMYFKGENKIYGNQAYFGAGLSLLQSSYMYLSPHTTILFHNNHAKRVGGALFSDFDIQFPVDSPCFFQVQIVNDMQNQLIDTVKIEFVNNTADYAGSAIYGGKVHQCHTFEPSEMHGESVYRRIFHVQNTEQNPSTVSSDPHKACFCFNNKTQPNCSISNYNVSVFPGDDFQVPIATVGGYLDGTVPGVVHSEILKEYNALLGPLQKAQNSPRLVCSNLNYTIFSLEKKVKILIAAEQVSFMEYDILPNANISVNLLGCPPAFQLDRDTRKCACEEELKAERIQCFIHNQTIQPPTGSWVGYYNGSAHNSTVKSGVLFHSHCPYCINSPVSVSINNTDSQCSDKHSGILCGQCSLEMSLTLGESICTSCSSVYLLLIPVFALAGILLVVILFVLRLTVSEGTINGLIFYANVVRMNSAVLFPSTVTNPLTVFIAWLNLDLGINVCFFNGMDGFYKTLLQFIFPLYIWVLVIVIIVLANRFTVVGRIVGGRAVQVLATLLLLSYTKLQRTIITILKFTTLKYPDNTVKYIWVYDGNVEYIHSKHAVLFAMAIICLLGFVLPYTVLLTLFKYFQACSDRKIMSWINKFKPVLDAYAGPYKDRYRLWTGFLLVIRTILIFALSLNIQASPKTNLFIVATVSLLLVAILSCTGGIYKKSIYTILETVSYINTGMLCLIVLYTGPLNYTVVYTSVGISFLLFTAVILYHTWKFTSMSTIIKRVACRNRWNVNQNEIEDEALLFERENDNEQTPLLREMIRTDSQNSKPTY